MKGVAMQVLSFPGVPLFETASRRIRGWDSEKDFSENMDWAGNELTTFLLQDYLQTHYIMTALNRFFQNLKPIF
jgi:hypothetical protein